MTDFALMSDKFDAHIAEAEEAAKGIVGSGEAAQAHALIAIAYAIRYIDPIPS